MVVLEVIRLAGIRYVRSPNFGRSNLELSPGRSLKFQPPYGQPYQQVNGPYGPINQGYQNGPNRPRGNGQFGRPQHQGRPRSRLNNSNTNQSLLNQLLSSFTRTNNGGTTRIMNKVSHKIKSYNEHFFKSTGQIATCDDIKQFLQHKNNSSNTSGFFNAYQPVQTGYPYPSATPYQSGAPQPVTINNFNMYG